MIGYERAAPVSYPRARARRASRAALATWPRSMLAALLVAVIVSGLCFAYLWQGTAILQLTAERESAKASLVRLEEMNRWLQFQIDQAFSLERVSRIAKVQLHMIEPTNVRYVRLGTVPTD